MKACKEILGFINSKLFPLNNSIIRYMKKDSRNYQDYCLNLTDEKWQEFKKTIMNMLACTSSDCSLCIEEVDLKRKMDEIVEKNDNGFLSKLNGTSLKGVLVQKHFGEIPAKGIMKVSFEKDKGSSYGLYTVTPASISFFQTPTGGLIISIRQPQAEGLMKNEPDVIIYKLFRRLDDVTRFDLLRALKFFMRCAEERTLWGKPTICGRIEYAWITKYRTKALSVILSYIENKIASLSFP